MKQTKMGEQKRDEIARGNCLLNWMNTGQTILLGLGGALRTQVIQKGVLHYLENGIRWSWRALRETGGWS